MKKFGKINGADVNKYILENDFISCEILDYGATLYSLRYKNRDIVLACPDMEHYNNNPECFGGTMGPIANRTARAEVTINGSIYHLEKNNGENNLHSSLTKGLHKRIWKATEGKNKICFELELKHMELGLPGNRRIKVIYSLSGSRLELEYEAISDRATIFNLTNHSYFNLCGHDSGSICSHKLKVNSDRMTIIGQGLIPTGEIRELHNSELSFAKEKEIGRDIDKENEQLLLAGGYDFNYCLDNHGELEEAAVLTAPDNSMRMVVYTTLPGIHIYTGNYISAEGKNGAGYGERSGVAFETQYYPDSNHHADFPDYIFDNRVYRSKTVFELKDL